MASVISLLLRPKGSMGPLTLLDFEAAGGSIGPVDDRVSVLVRFPKMSPIVGQTLLGRRFRSVR